MKRAFAIVLICLLFVFLLPLDIGYAHSGGTDENGGHYDHSTGEYHYHHGYPAHQHPNGRCPYAFDDNTDTDTKNYIDNDDVNVERNNKDDVNSENMQTLEDSEKTILTDRSFASEIIAMLFTSSIFALLLSCVPFLFIIFISMRFKFLDDFDFFNHKILYILCIPSTLYWWYRQTMFLFDVWFFVFYSPVFVYCGYITLKWIQKEKENKKKYEEERHMYIEKYSGKDILNLCSAPPNAYVDEHGMPHLLVKGKDLFAVYVVRNGNVFHRIDSSCTHNGKRENYFRVRYRRPCARCNPPVPDITWYTKYIEIQKIKEKYNIK